MPPSLKDTLAEVKVADLKSPAKAIGFLARVFPNGVLLLVWQARRILGSTGDNIVGLLLLPFVILNLAIKDVQERVHARTAAVEDDPRKFEQVAHSEQKKLSSRLRKKVKRFVRILGRGSGALAVAVYNTIVRLMLVPVATLLQLLVVLVLEVFQFAYILVKGKQLIIEDAKTVSQPLAAYAQGKMRALLLLLLNKATLKSKQKQNVRATLRSLPFVPVSTTPSNVAVIPGPVINPVPSPTLNLLEDQQIPGESVTRTDGTKFNSRSLAFTPIKQ